MKEDIVQAREFSQEERERLAESGQAMPDGSFPIVTREDLENAIQAIGRAKDPEAAKRHIKKRASALGAEELIPEGWNKLEAVVDVESIEPRAHVGRKLLARTSTSSKDWYRIENKVGNPLAEVYIYDEIGMFGVSASDFSRDLRALDATELTVHLNSPGGEVFEGFAIYQALRNHKATVTIQVDSLAASIASVIAMAADTLVMGPRATMMIHDALTVSMGNASEMRQTADLLDKMSDNIAATYAEKAGGDASFWRDRMRDETWYSAEEALEAGLIDQIEGRETAAEPEISLIAASFQHTGREAAPAPVLKPAAVAVETPAETLPVTEEKEKSEEFQWDFAAFQQALRGGFTA